MNSRNWGVMLFNVIFKLLTTCWLTLFPLTGILYLVYFQTPERFPLLGFHKVAILFAELLSAFIAYVAYRSFKNSRSDFLRYITLGYLGFTLIYSFHGLLTDHAPQNLAQFIIFGPLSRLVMSAYLFLGLSHLKVLQEEVIALRKNLFWPHILFFIGVAGFGCVYTWHPGAVPLIHIKYIEAMALTFSLASIIKVFVSPARSYIMKFHLVAQMLFIQASTAFILSSPWTSLWWFAHLISGTGFLLLGYAIVVTYEKTNSLAVVYDETILHHILNRIIDNSPVGILVADGELNLIRSNKELHQMLGRDKTTLNLSDLFTAMGFDTQALQLTAFGASAVIEHSFQLTVAGNTKYFEAKLTKLDDKHTDGYLVILLDVTEKYLAAEKIMHMAKYDALTGLANRILFRERLAKALAAAKTAGSMCAVLFVDLDGFKNINDTLGHDAGDAVLKEAAQRLMACVRQRDTVARMGGDEFTVILTDIADKTEIYSVAEKIVFTLACPVITACGEAFVTSSVGISVCPLDGTDAETLLTKADCAMYAAKHNGKNRYTFYDDNISIIS